jgi:hypothetical protein
MARSDGPIPLSEKVLSVHGAFTEARIPHAIGGALALTYYAEPRATIDMDINVFASVDRWPQVRDALEPLGVDVTANQKALDRDGQVRLWWGKNAVDLFFSYDPFHDEMQRAARRAPLGGRTIPVLAPEHLLVCKAMFDRPKDWLDIEQVIVATDPLDLPEVEAWLTSMVGEENPRLNRLRELREQLAR